MFDLVYPDAEQVNGPQIGIYSHNKQTEISGRILEKFFDQVQILFFPDRLDGNFRSFFGVIGIFFQLDLFLKFK